MFHGPDKTLRRELKIRRAGESFDESNFGVFHECLILLLTENDFKRRN